MKITVGEELFRFESRQEWINKGRSWYATCGVRSHDLVTIDAAGRIVRSGAEFSRAEREGSYPVVVYCADADVVPSVALSLDGFSREIKRRTNG